MEKIYQVNGADYMVIKQNFAGAVFHRKTDDGRFLIKTANSRIQGAIELYVLEVNIVQE